MCKKSLKPNSEYIQGPFNCCPDPECKSDVLEGGSVQIEGNKAIQEVSCVTCNLVWEDTYTLSSYKAFE